MECPSGIRKPENSSPPHNHALQLNATLLTTIPEDITTSSNHQTPKRKATLRILPLKSECIKFHFSVDDFQQFSSNNNPIFSLTRTSIIQDSLITVAMTVDGNLSITTPLIMAALSQTQIKISSFSTTRQQSIIRLYSSKKISRTANLGIAEINKSQHYQKPNLRRTSRRELDGEELYGEELDGGTVWKGIGWDMRGNCM